MPEFQPVESITPVEPSPSILTSGRNRTNDGFGVAGAATLDAATEENFPDPVELARIRELLTAWRTGIAWPVIGCSPSYVEKVCEVYTEADAGDRRHAPGENTQAQVEPFKIYTPLACGWTTVQAGDRIANDADALTRVHTARHVARALWLGEGLRDDTDVLTLRREATDVSLGGVASDLDDAVAELLVRYDDCTGGQGGAVLHIPGVMIPGALGGIPQGGRVAWPEGNLYRGPLSSVVSPGPGYPHGVSAAGAGGYGPLLVDTPDDGVTPSTYQGNAADEVWVYVTGPVEYALGDIIVLPEGDIERRNYARTNTYEVWGERLAIVRFDPCCVFAAKVLNTAGPVS